jgi:hypothetical protein
MFTVCAPVFATIVRYYGRAQDGSPRSCGATGDAPTTTSDSPSGSPNGSSEPTAASRLALSAEEFTALLQHCGLLQAYTQQQQQQSQQQQQQSQQQSQQQILDKQLLDKPLQNGALQNGGASSNGALADTGKRKLYTLCT